MSVLADIVADTRRRVAARRRPPGLFREALRGAPAGRVALIAEHKRRSPSAGVIREDLTLADVVGAYERGGAAALSVLTEESRFGGSLDDIRAAREASQLPILRKDFIVDPYQLAEAAAAGADAVLLIVAALDPGRLASLHRLAAELGLDALVEVHDRAELEVALRIDAAIVGINNRNLATLAIDLETTYELLPLIPDGVVRVAESGFSRRAELDRLAEAGVDAVLVGEALMRSALPEDACRELAR